MKIQAVLLMWFHTNSFHLIRILSTCLGPPEMYWYCEGFLFFFLFSILFSYCPPNLSFFHSSFSTYLSSISHVTLPFSCLLYAFACIHFLSHIYVLDSLAILASLYWIYKNDTPSPPNSALLLSACPSLYSFLWN